MSMPLGAPSHGRWTQTVQHPDPRLVDVVSAAYRVLARGLAERLEEEGATVDQWRVLRAVAAGDGVSMSELADRLQLPAPSLTRVVDSLVDRATVYRRQSVHDRRRVDAHLSEAGAVLLERLEAIAEAHERQVTAPWGPGEVAATVHALERLLGPCVSPAPTPSSRT